MGLSRLFRSRWAALLWAAGIVWTAIDVAGSTPPPPPPVNAAAASGGDATGAAVDAADLAILANAGG